MAHFAYTARSKTGEKASGNVKAPNKAAAIKEVERMGLFPVTIEETNESLANLSANRASAHTAPKPVAIPSGQEVRRSIMAQKLGTFLGLVTGISVWYAFKLGVAGGQSFGGGILGFVAGTLAAYIATGVFTGLLSLILVRRGRPDHTNQQQADASRTAASVIAPSAVGTQPKEAALRLSLLGRLRRSIFGGVKEGIVVIVGIVLVCFGTGLLLMIFDRSDSEHAPVLNAAQTCRATRQRIEGAKYQWALDNRKLDADEPTDADLFGPGRYLPKRPTCPSGGSYTLGGVTNFPRCSIPGHTFP